ncbi:hypothetical protein K469DRAFT_808769 [Zopfia rhizophila CBS 207.26]|uniref:Uncharacterized protein n=1 Tax=Zopfia rhizophila CBS 207.26 TaxID=1314779 RepID=A0A6A6EKJ5_9PEZI|nr:hypothetical protein K469DRAFT_808769 [Zopfia rhizophila CBS 207.26]
MHFLRFGSFDRPHLSSATPQLKFFHPTQLLCAYPTTAAATIQATATMATEAAELVIGQTSKGCIGSYVLTKKLEDCVWVAP